MKLTNNTKPTTNPDVALFEGVGEMGLVRLPKLGVGSYVVKIDKRIFRASENVRTKHLRFAILEVTVTKAEEGSANPAGSTAVISMNTSWPSFGKTVTSLLVGSGHMKQEDVTPEKALEFFDESTDVGELQVGVRVTSGQGKSGHDFLAYNFTEPK